MRIDHDFHVEAMLRRCHGGEANVLGERFDLHQKFQE